MVMVTGCQSFLTVTDAVAAVKDHWPVVILSAANSNSSFKFLKWISIWNKPQKEFLSIYCKKWATQEKVFCCFSLGQQSHKAQSVLWQSICKVKVFMLWQSIWQIFSIWIISEVLWNKSIHNFIYIYIYIYIYKYFWHYCWSHKDSRHSLWFRHSQDVPSVGSFLAM